MARVLPRLAAAGLALDAFGGACVVSDSFVKAVAALPGLGWLDIQATVAQFEGTLAPQVSLEGEAAQLRQAGRTLQARARTISTQPPRDLAASTHPPAGVQ